MTNHGMTVNLYQVAKMFEDDSIQNIREMLEESFEIDKRYYRNYKHMTFEEYVNAKRHFIASVLGVRECL